MLGHERHREGQVPQWHHNRRREPQNIRTSEFQNQNDQDIVRHVEKDIDRRVQRGFVTHVGKVAVENRVVAQITLETVPQIRGQTRG